MRALVTGGLRVRGWTWSLSMLWVVAGTVGTGYDFYITTKPYTWADVEPLGIEGWSTDPVAVQIAVVLATVASLALPIPALIAGFIRLRSLRPRNWLQIAAWAGACIAGFALIYQAGVWGNYPANCPAIADNCPAIGSPAVVSWGELGICAAWLVLGAVMTWILAGPVHRSDVPDTSSRLSSAKGSRLPPGTDDVQARNRAWSVPDWTVIRRQR